MAGITSLVVKIGAQDAEITAALAKLGSNVKRTDDEFKKLGASPIAQQAQRSLETINTALQQVQGNQSRLADRAKLAAAGLEAMGGPAKLTARELDQVNRVIQQGLDAFRALGQQAPKELEKVAASVAQQRKALASGGSLGGGLGQVSDLLGGVGLGTGALSAAGVAGAFIASSKAALDYADSLTKLADRTGVSIEGLQRLQAVAEPSGNTLDQVATAVNQFQKRIATGSKDTASALGEIGLTIGQLQALSPDEQFFAIAKGIQTIKDPAEQTRIAMELFGKSGAELLPTLKADVDSLKDSTVKMSTESAKALDDLGDAFGRWKNSAIGAVGEVLGQIVRMRTNGGSTLAGIFALTPVLGANLVGQTAAAGLSNAINSTGPIPASVRTSDRQLSTPGGLGPSVTGVQAQIELERGLAAQLKASEAAVKAIADAEKKRAEGQRQYEAGLKRFADAQKAIDAAMEGYVDVAATVNGSTVEAIRYLRAHGASMSDLATYYGLTAQQADAVARKLDFEALVAKAAAGIHAKLATSVYDTGKALEKLNSIPNRTRIPTLQSGPNAQLTSAATDAAKEYRRAIDQIADSMVQLAQVSDGAWGDITKDIAGVVVALSAAGHAIEHFNEAKTTGGKIAAGVEGAVAFEAATRGGQGKARGFASGAASGATLGFEIGTVVPGIGNVVGAVVGGVIGGVVGYLRNLGPTKDEKDARVIEGRFESSYGGLTNLTNRVGDAYAALGRQRADAEKAVKAMLDAEKQGADAVSEAIANLQATIDHADAIRNAASQFGPSHSDLVAARDSAKEVYEYMVRLQAQGEYTQEQVNAAYVAWQRSMAQFDDAAGEAARAWLKLHDAAESSATSASKAMDELKAKRDGLAQSIANEAPEAVMGVIEAQTRGQIAALDAQMQAQQRALEAQAATSAEQATSAIADAFDGFTVHVGVVYDFPNTTGVEKVPAPDAVPVSRGGLVIPGGVQYLDRGGRVLPYLPKGTDTVPAMLTPGELVINAAQQGRLASALVGGSASQGTSTIVLETDGRVFAELVAPHLPGVLKRYRVA